MTQPIFNTERLLLKPRGLADLKAAVAINSDPRVLTYLGTLWPSERKWAHLAAQMLRSYGPGLGYWSIFERDAPGDLLGWVGLIPLGEDPEIQLAYRLKVAAWGAGIATEAASRLMEHGFATLDLQCVVAWVHPENLGSRRVMAKLGFQRSGDYGDPPQYTYRRVNEAE